MGMASGGGGGLNSEINVTPMVDIMLVLLIIFMLVTPQLQQGITVEIPKETSNAVDDNRGSSSRVRLSMSRVFMANGLASSWPPQYRTVWAPN